MGIYSRELFAAAETTPPVAAEAPAQACTNTACTEHDASFKLSSAVAMTIVEGYVMFKAKNKTLSSVEDAMTFLSTFTKQFIDNGDMTLADLEAIKNHVKAKAYIFASGSCPGCKHKLIAKILEQCGCSSGECNEVISKVIAKKQEFHAAIGEAMKAFGPSIDSAINQFINRYGRGFDESYINDWKGVGSC